LYVNAVYHEQIGTYEQGGGMVYEVDNEHATFAAMPQRLEAGTPSVADAVGLAAAIDYLKHEITYAWLEKHIAMLSSYALRELQAIPQLHILGSSDTPRHAISFIIDGIHAHDIASYLDRFGICVRAGHHCAQPLAQSLGVASSVRVSLYAYNTIEEIDRLVKALKELSIR
jgi:cysteine desulfurase/selenocysteine lyase